MLRQTGTTAAPGRLVRMRNTAGHAAFGIGCAIIRETAIVDVPRLREQVAAILAAEEAEPGVPEASSDRPASCTDFADIRALLGPPWAWAWA